jgi:hypothetical protein
MEMRSRSQDIRYRSKNRWDRRTGDVLYRLLHKMQNARNSRNSGEEHVQWRRTCGVLNSLLLMWKMQGIAETVG